jgi:hypothetical protein
MFQELVKQYALLIIHDQASPFLAMSAQLKQPDRSYTYKIPRSFMKDLICVHLVFHTAFYKDHLTQMICEMRCSV